MPTLKNLRGAAGLSQTELANASGVSLEAIKKIESGKVERPHPATLRLLAGVLGQVPVVMNGSRGGAAFDQSMFDNARRGEIGCIVILPQPGLGISLGFVPLKQTTLSGSIVGPIAQLQLSQRFAYQRSECDRVIEAVYRFPLPGDAAITSVRVRFGEVVVQTRLAAREEAERQYAAARQQGHQAALATRESADVLTLQLAGLQPDQEVIVDTEFVQAAAPHGLGWELRVPLTIGPRYSRPDEAGSAASRGQPLQVWRDPGHRFSLDLHVSEAESVRSASHALNVLADATGQHVRLAQGTVVPDRDLVFEWLPRREAARPMLNVVMHEDLEEGERYFLALITPPESDSQAGVHREMTLLVDRSGSMQGPKWEACRWAVRRFLASLTPDDRFRLGLFQSRCDWQSATPIPGTQANCEQAVAFVDGHGPDGGTELGPALEQALRAPTSNGHFARHVLLFTDGQVSDDARILQLAEAEAERAGGRRLSVISIDASPRSAFVRALVEAGGGEAVFLSSDPRDEDITSALDRVLDKWARPLATDLELSVATSARSVQARHALGQTRSRLRLGDLPGGRSLWVSGAMSLFAEPVFQLSVSAGSTVLAEHALDLDAAPPARPAIRAVFGARRRPAQRAARRRDGGT